MFFDPRQRRIWVHLDPIDMRKGLSGLSYLVTHIVMSNKTHYRPVAKKAIGAASNVS